MFDTASTQSTIGALPTQAAQYGGPLPRELREEASAMSIEAFQAAYAPAAGPFRLGHWQCTDVDRPASVLGPQPRHYRATIAVGDRISTSSVAACGPVAALTEMLHERGMTVEIGTFRQTQAQGSTATFIRGSDGVRAEWGMGCSADPMQSALRALIACANRLHAGPGGLPGA